MIVIVIPVVMVMVMLVVMIMIFEFINGYIVHFANWTLSGLGTATSLAMHRTHVSTGILLSCLCFGVRLFCRIGSCRG
jgi:hypothetical protein